MTYYLVPRQVKSARAAARIALAVMVTLAVGAKVLADQEPSGVGQPVPPLATLSPARGTPTATPEAGDGTVVVGIPLNADDGYIPEGEYLSPFDDAAPAVTRLDPSLREALQQAATDAQEDGITMVVNSGWRSAEYQEALLKEAVLTYGSEEEAAKWVDTPEQSNHVKGEAVDIGFTDADYWLIEHGADYGLCQTFANEIWHFQLMTTPGGVCPLPISDASAG